MLCSVSDGKGPVMSCGFCQPFNCLVICVITISNTILIQTELKT